MDDEKLAEKAKLKNKTNIRIDNKINNRQVTIIKEKCNDGKKCPEVKKRKGKIRKRLIEIHRCVPIQLKCDGTSPSSFKPVFISATSSSIIKHPSGTITITNTSDTCTMEVSINRINGDHGTVQVGPSSSFTSTVSNLKSVEIRCKGSSDSKCTGTLDLDLFFIVEF